MFSTLAEMHDVIDCELRRYYPHLVKKHARVLLVELSDHILSRSACSACTDAELPKGLCMHLCLLT